jgi:hypothetical protein
MELLPLVTGVVGGFGSWFATAFIAEPLRKFYGMRREIVQAILDSENVLAPYKERGDGTKNFTDEDKVRLRDANACIASSRVASKPCTGSWPSLKARAIDHTQGLLWCRRELDSVIRPTICASAITSYWVGLPVGWRNRSVIAATNPLPPRAGSLALAGSRVTGGHLKLDGSPRCRRPPQPAQQRRWRGTIPWQPTDAT